ncbi:MAG: SGNH/GDSL hydrolase family protein [Lachnospiraceae bacterium]|nr:SGNH/GDSL hydrolase family protein [Lachnospiraceae bacterium]
MERHKIIRYVGYAVLSVLIFFVLLYLAGKIFTPKYETGVREGGMTQDYYLEELPHDLIFLGDCEVYENFSPVILWQEAGITSYIRGNSQQLIWQSYYLLKETLEYETPRVVILNVHSMRFNAPQNEAYNRMMLDTMKWSSYKAAAVKTSMTEGESFLSYVFPLLRYHDRWNELTFSDVRYMFDHEPSTVAGYLVHMDVSPMTRLPKAPILTDPDFGATAWQYLDLIRETCEEEGVQLILIKSSSIWPTWYEEWDQQITDYAAEYGLTYINFIDHEEELGIDWTTDTYDGGLHLNLYGAEKASAWLAAYLSEECDLPDHRGEAAFEADWNAKIRKQESIKALQLEELETYGYLKSWMPEEDE